MLSAPAFAPEAADAPREGTMRGDILILPKLLRGLARTGAYRILIGHGLGCSAAAASSQKPLNRIRNRGFDATLGNRSACRLGNQRLKQCRMVVATGIRPVARVCIRLLTQLSQRVLPMPRLASVVASLARRVALLAARILRTRPPLARSAKRLMQYFPAVEGKVRVLLWSAEGLRAPSRVSGRRQLVNLSPNAQRLYVLLRSAINQKVQSD